MGSIGSILQWEALLILLHVVYAASIGIVDKSSPFRTSEVVAHGAEFPENGYQKLQARNIEGKESSDFGEAGTMKVICPGLGGGCGCSGLAGEDEEKQRIWLTTMCNVCDCCCPP